MLASDPIIAAVDSGRYPESLKFFRDVTGESGKRPPPLDSSSVSGVEGPKKPFSTDKGVGFQSRPGVLGLESRFSRITEGGRIFDGL